MKNDYIKEKKKQNSGAQQRECVLKKEGIFKVFRQPPLPPPPPPRSFHCFEFQDLATCSIW